MGGNLNKNYYCVIMAGGIGSRFWPMSRTAKPKQFLDILGLGKTLLQLTYERSLTVCPPENIIVVTHKTYKDLVTNQLPNLSENQILYEPARKNTAPCIAYACHKIASINPNASMVVAPADHIITKEGEYSDIILSALEASQKEDCLITLGITPHRPNTGYGYIQVNEDAFLASNTNIKKIKTFTEKPDVEMARFFLTSGDFYWNSGIFIWSAKSILKAFETHLPDIYAIFKEGEAVYNTPSESEFINNIYASCKNISVDYGIMEKAKNAYVLCANFGWSDLGTWGALYEHASKTLDGNHITGKNVMLYNSKNNIINVPQDKLVVLQGLEGYIIVDSNNILLICPKEEEHEIKQFVNTVKVEKGEKYI
jgi:mannose-1-phosphate guanylyltransferase